MMLFIYQDNKLTGEYWRWRGQTYKGCETGSEAELGQIFSASVVLFSSLWILIFICTEAFWAKEGFSFSFCFVNINKIGKHDCYSYKEVVILNFFYISEAFIEIIFWVLSYLFEVMGNPFRRKSIGRRKTIA